MICVYLKTYVDFQNKLQILSFASKMFDKASSASMPVRKFRVFKENRHSQNLWAL